MEEVEVMDETNLDQDLDRIEEEEDENKEGKGSEFLGRSLIKARTILISDPVDHKLTTRVIALS